MFVCLFFKDWSYVAVLGLTMYTKLAQSHSNLLDSASPELGLKLFITTHGLDYSLMLNVLPENFPSKDSIISFHLSITNNWKQKEL